MLCILQEEQEKMQQSEAAGKHESKFAEQEKERSEKMKKEIKEMTDHFENQVRQKAKEQAEVYQCSKNDLSERQQVWKLSPFMVIIITVNIATF